PSLHDALPIFSHTLLTLRKSSLLGDVNTSRAREDNLRLSVMAHRKAWVSSRTLISRSSPRFPSGGEHRNHPALRSRPWQCLRGDSSLGSSSARASPRA